MFFIPVITFLSIAFSVYYVNFPMENALAAWIRGTINQCLLCLFLLISTICVSIPSFETDNSRTNRK